MIETKWVVITLDPSYWPVDVYGPFSNETRYAATETIQRAADHEDSEVYLVVVREVKPLGM